MYKIYQTLPHGVIKIPFPVFCCFEGEIDAIVDIAVKTGETAAEVENISEKVEELEQKEENRKWWEGYTEDQFTRLFTRMYELEDRVAALEAVEVIKEEEEKETPEESTEETVITSSEVTEETKEEPAKPKRSAKLWGVL